MRLFNILTRPHGASLLRPHQGSCSVLSGSGRGWGGSEGQGGGLTSSRHRARWRDGMRARGRMQKNKKNNNNKYKNVLSASREADFRRGSALKKSRSGSPLQKFRAGGKVNPSKKKKKTCVRARRHGSRVTSAARSSSEPLNAPRGKFSATFRKEPRLL